MALKFDSIKSLFIVEEKNPDVKKEEKTPEIKKEAHTKDTGISWSSSAGNTTNTTTSVTGSTGKSEHKTGAFNNKIFNSLTKAISNANLHGEDYLEFVQALKAMKDIPLDLNIKIQTVLATLSTKGLTTQKVIETADFYLNVLDNEKRKFNDALSMQRKTGISKKEENIKSIDKANRDKAKLIEGLSKEIKENQQKMEKIKQEILQSEVKIKKTENDFLITFDTVANQIKSNVEKIKAINNL